MYMFLSFMYGATARQNYRKKHLLFVNEAHEPTVNYTVPETNHKSKRMCYVI